MTRLTLLLVIVLFIQSVVSAQFGEPCLPDGITFTYQNQIDNFQANYPNCTEIEGDVTIGYRYSDVINLDGLSVLTSIGGNLLIANTYLTSLAGLDSLNSIGGDLEIGDIYNPNGHLSSLTGIEGLTSIGGDLIIEANEVLTSLTGMDNLISIDGDLIIGSPYNTGSQDNPVLSSLTGLDNLTIIGGQLIIRSNKILTDLTGLSSLTTIGGDLSVYRNQSLTSLVGLDNIEATSIDSLYIHNNTSLLTCEIQSICEYLLSPNGSINIYRNATGCNNPNEIADACGITMPCLPHGNYYLYTRSEIDNFSTNYPDCNILAGDVEIGHFGGSIITSLGGLNSVTSIQGDLQIKYNDSLVSLTGLNNLSTIGGGLFVFRNDALTSLNGLNNATSIGGDLWIGKPYENGNDALTSLSGLNNVTTIGGDLLIESCDALSSLTGLDNLTVIGGDLGIGPSSYPMPGRDVVGLRNASLTSLNGLDNLTSIGGNLRINDNDALINLAGLENLTAINGNLLFFYNDSLINFTGLESVSSIVEGLTIYYNATLTNLAGLNNVSSIGGDLLFYGNDSLTSLSGLDNLTSIGGDLSIGYLEPEHGHYSGNAALINLNGLDKLTTVSGNLNVYTNNALTSLSGLENVTNIGGRLTIYDNDALNNITGLDNISANSITDLYIYNNDSLSYCDVGWLCEYLSNPNGGVNIYNNATGCDNPPEIAEACGFTLSCLPYGNYYFYSKSHIDNFESGYPDCTSLEGNVQIVGDDITNLNGLNVITNISGSLIVGESQFGGVNPNLITLTGLEGLTSIGEDLNIIDNKSLSNLSGLDNLTSINDRLEIGKNGKLIKVDGLEGLNSIGGDLDINFNSNLTNLNGLENLTLIGGELRISWNHSLPSLAGLESIDAASISHLTIFQNELLSTCEIQSVCDYLVNLNGSHNINYNAEGCRHTYQIRDACETVSVYEVSISEKISIYPNPSSTQITIELPNAPQKNAVLGIYNMNAQQMLTSKITEQKAVIDISGLPKGIYFIKVADESSLMTGKLVKN